MVTFIDHDTHDVLYIITVDYNIIIVDSKQLQAMISSVAVSMSYKLTLPLSFYVALESSILYIYI